MHGICGIYTIHGVCTVLIIFQDNLSFGCFFCFFIAHGWNLNLLHLLMDSWIFCGFSWAILGFCMGVVGFSLAGGAVHTLSTRARWIFSGWDAVHTLSTRCPHEVVGFSLAGVAVHTRSTRCPHELAGFLGIFFGWLVFLGIFSGWLDFLGIFCGFSGNFMFLA